MHSIEITPFLKTLFLKEENAINLNEIKREQLILNEVALKVIKNIKENIIIVLNLVKRVQEKVIYWIN